MAFKFSRQLFFSFRKGRNGYSNESKPFEQSAEFNMRIIEVKKDALRGRNISQKSFERK